MKTLALRQFSLKVGSTAILQDISLSFNAGEKVALVGRSGAGKTTLLNALYQISPERCALCPQQGGLVDILSAYHNIYMGQLENEPLWRNVLNLVRPLASHRQAISLLAEQFGLGDKLWHSVDRLSGGQRQRVALARACYRNQPLFLGDEPVSSLDPLQAMQILEQVLNRHTGAIVALHNRRMTLALFDRVVGLMEGRVVLDAPTHALDPAELDRFYDVDERC